jgi:hypothetical protein
LASTYKKPRLSVAERQAAAASTLLWIGDGPVEEDSFSIDPEPLPSDSTPGPHESLSSAIVERVDGLAAELAIIKSDVVDLKAQVSI